MSAIPPEIRELDQHGMIAWTEGMSVRPDSYTQFRAFAAKYGVDIDNSSHEPQTLNPAGIPPADQKRLLEFTYQLNARGRSLYRLIIDSVLKQIHA
jgi:hypothetical protein